MKIRLIKQPCGKPYFAHRLGIAVAAWIVVVSTSIGFRASAQSTAPELMSVTATTIGDRPANQLSHNNESFQVVTADGFPSAADSLAEGTAEAMFPGAVEPVGFRHLGSCSSCGGGCQGACGNGPCSYPSLGPNFRRNCGGGFSPYSGYNDPCGSCQPFCYAMVDLLYVERDGKERYTLSPNFAMNGFDYEYGGRVTVGRIPNCLNGWEASFTGQLDWSMGGAISVPGGTIDTFLRPSGSIAATDLSAFNDTTIASTQRYDAEYWSVELNAVSLGWDYTKCIYGLRYLQYDELFQYNALNNAGDAGYLRSEVENRMVGFQVGMDLLYPIGRHAFTDFRSRVGGFVNFLDSGFGVINAGNTIVGNSHSREDLAGLAELSLGVRYQLGQMLAVRAGAEIWYLTGIGAADDQFTVAISPVSGIRARADDDFLLTGLSVGAELRY